MSDLVFCCVPRLNELLLGKCPDDFASNFRALSITRWPVRARPRLADELQQIMARIEPGTKNQASPPDLLFLRLSGKPGVTSGID